MNEPDPVFLALLRRFGLPEPTPELRFHPKRRWRFDYAWEPSKVALEVEGGVWTRGRHTRGSGFLKDMKKYNEAARLGWRVVRTTPEKLRGMETIELVADLLDTPTPTEERKR